MRPVDLHVKALQKMGAEISTDHGYVTAQAPGGRLHGAHVAFEKITVTGTENVLMAAVLAEGETIMENCARERLTPDGMGAQIWEYADAGVIPAEQAVLLVRAMLSAGLDTTILAIAITLNTLLAWAAGAEGVPQR